MQKVHDITNELQTILCYQQMQSLRHKVSPYGCVSV